MPLDRPVFVAKFTSVSFDTDATAVVLFLCELGAHK